MMYSFLDLGAFLLQGKKIQESAIQFLCINFSSNGDSVFSQALKSSRVS
ncbi:Carbamate kinase [Vibrio chagasii]|nr:Carbamate kinase [Vibrio chagasii]